MRCRRHRVIGTTRSRGAVGIISGRRLTDLVARVGLEGIVYAGNHGAEIRGRGLRFVEPLAFLLAPTLKSTLARLESKLRHLPHVRVENKGLTGTVHVRGADDEEIAKASEVILSAMHSTPGLRCLVGRDTFDILPQNGWTKGAAAHWIRRGLGMDHALVIYAGDDSSDEEAFSALAGAITIKVGREPTQASYKADSPAEVWAFLDRLAGVLSFPATASTGLVQPSS